MTPAAAQHLQDRATAAGEWCMWFVTRMPDGYLARAKIADNAGGTWAEGELMAATLDELRGMLPRGLTRQERTMLVGVEVVETWD